MVEKRKNTETKITKKIQKKKKTNSEETHDNFCTPIDVLDYIDVIVKVGGCKYKK